ncbi:MAG: hypothetical protein HW377_1964 [Actinobacteria bacterium]|nr:hypothetical protein [Actinomycetota bacterium]
MEGCPEGINIYRIYTNKFHFWQRGARTGSSLVTPLDRRVPSRGPAAGHAHDLPKLLEVRKPDLQFPADLLHRANDHPGILPVAGETPAERRLRDLRIMYTPFDHRSPIPIPSGMFPRDGWMRIRFRLAATKRPANIGLSLDALDGRGSVPGVVRWTGTRIHRSGAIGGGAWKHRNGCDARPIDRKKADHCGDGSWNPEVIKLDIGLLQED